MKNYQRIKLIYNFVYLQVFFADPSTRLTFFLDYPNAKTLISRFLTL